VTGGATGVRQGALLDEHDVPPAEPGEVVSEAVAHDAGADDHHAGSFRKRAHAESVLHEREPLVAASRKDTRPSGGGATPRGPPGERIDSADVDDQSGPRRGHWGGGHGPGPPLDDAA